MMPTPHKFTEAETLLGGALPHRRDEAWKWTDVRAAVKDTPSGLTKLCTPIFELPDGLKLTRAERTPKDHPMSQLAARFAGESYVVDVPAGFKSQDALKLSGLSHGHARIFIKMAKGTELDVSEVHDSGEPGFVNVEINFDLGEGAILKRSVHHKDHPQTTRIAISQINAWGNAQIEQHTLSFGAAMARFETNLAGLGEGLKAEIHGAYLLDEKRHTDLTSYIDLTVKDAFVRQSVKGVVADQARGVFQGKFHVRRPAQHADAEMRHDALMLSDTCEVRAKPELEIYADDVACAHGNTIGALDESALFYMRQRGLPAAQARAMLTEAFVADAFEDLDVDHKDEFLSDVRAWLEARS